MSLKTIVEVSRDRPEQLYVIPFGGCGEFGLNMTAYIVSGKTYIVDCGQMFPEPYRLGVEGVIPDIDSWFEDLGGVSAYFITHGHEDHIGALPYILPRWPAPVYAPPWATKLINAKFERKLVGDHHPRFDLNEVQAGDVVRNRELSVEYVHINHSIPHTCSLVLRTRSHTVFHTGDFKLDASSPYEAAYDADYLENLGDSGIDLVVCDSTNAGKEGFGPGEAVVKPALKQLIGNQLKGRCYLTTFSSNLWRLRTVIDICQEVGRKLVVSGTGIDSSLAIAADLDLLSNTSDVLVDPNDTKTINREENLVVLTTGSQGEYRASLPRIVYDGHKQFRLQAGDNLVFSSRIIPGNERQIFTLMSEAQRQGAVVHTERSVPNIHVSGHAYGGEIESLIKLLRPKHFIPVHGTYTQMKENFDVAVKAGLRPKDCLVIGNGDVVELSEHGLRTIDQIEVGRLFIDGGSLQPIELPTLRERLAIGEAGLAVAFGALRQNSGKWLIKPSITIKGLPIINSDELLQDAASEVMVAVSSHWHAGTHDEPGLCEVARVTLRRFLTQIYRRKPIVIFDLTLV